jgi:membrane-associated phospholipid phosphatase
MAYRQPTYDYSLEFIANWQDNATESKTDFFKFVSLFGGQDLVIIVYAFSTRKLLIKFLAVIFTAQVANNFLKIFYHDLRPYYSSDEIVAMNCSCGYGNPSGHCLLTFSVYGSLWVLLFTEKYDKNTSLFPRRW